jgi:very-short-patch-repair endonuclease
LEKGGRGDFKNRTMLKYNTRLKSKARQLRKNLTESEHALWLRLRGKQLAGIQFYRQKPIGDFIVDFYAPKAKLVIEIDGCQHLEAHYVEKDKQRDDYLYSLGLMVIRFNSRQVLKETDSTLEFIYRIIEERMAK